MTNRGTVIPLLLALSMALSPAAIGQCFTSQDDGFDTGCCNLAAPTLPLFPPVTVTSEYGALTGCAQTFVVPPFPVQFSPPFFVFCDLALINVFVQLAPGHTISGTLIAKYVRTWTDFTSPVSGQVYRFLVNGDLTCTAPGSIAACTTILPRCAAVNPVVHFDGHIDYACDPSIPGGGVSVSFSLNHLQGCISHPFWSCVPIFTQPEDHVEVSYHIVGPAPFFFTPSPVPQGIVTGDSIRSTHFRLWPNFAYQCFGESRIPNLAGANFLINSSPQHCSCGVFDNCFSAPIFCPPTGCYVEQFILGMECCNGGPMPAYQGIPFGGTPFANTGFLAQSVGSWGGGGFYPGSGSLSVYFGVLLYNDPCGHANWNVHAVTGVGVSGIFGQPFSTSPPCAPPVQIANAFIDLQNCLPLTSINLNPGYGCISIPDVVWSFTL